MPLPLFPLVPLSTCCTTHRQWFQWKATLSARTACVILVLLPVTRVCRHRGPALHPLVEASYMLYCPGSVSSFFILKMGGKEMMVAVQMHCGSLERFCMSRVCGRARFDRNSCFLFLLRVKPFFLFGGLVGCIGRCWPTNLKKERSGI